MRADKFYFVYGSVDHNKFTILTPGEYILMDRHFNCVGLTESEMDQLIAKDYANFKRSEVSP